MFTLRLMLAALLTALAVGCVASEPPAEQCVGAKCDDPDGPPPEEEPVDLRLSNQGGALEGHASPTGAGPGLFAGDDAVDLAAGDGAEIYLTFDLAALPPDVELAGVRLASDYMAVIGDPFTGLGAVIAEEIRYDEFSADLLSLGAREFSCVFAETSDSAGCDVTEVIDRARADGYPFAQFRLRFETASDGDGEPDLVAFFTSDMYTNEVGMFELLVNFDEGGPVEEIPPAEL